MALKTILAMAVAAIGGIYLTSDEGKNAREALKEKKTIFEPVIKDLLKQANDVLDGKQKINSPEIRANIDKLIDSAKKTLIDIDLDKTIEGTKKAISVASKKIRIASMELDEKPKSTKKSATRKTKKPTSKKATSKKPTSKKAKK